MKLLFIAFIYLNKPFLIPLLLLMIILLIMLYFIIYTKDVNYNNTGSSWVSEDGKRGGGHG